MGGIINVKFTFLNLWFVDQFWAQFKINPIKNREFKWQLIQHNISTN